MTMLEEVRKMTGDSIDLTSQSEQQSASELQKVKAKPRTWFQKRNDEKKPLAMCQGSNEVSPDDRREKGCSNCGFLDH